MKNFPTFVCTCSSSWNTKMFLGKFATVVWIPKNVSSRTGSGEKQQWLNFQIVWYLLLQRPKTYKVPRKQVFYETTFYESSLLLVIFYAFLQYILTCQFLVLRSKILIAEIKPKLSKQFIFSILFSCIF